MICTTDRWETDLKTSDWTFGLKHGWRFNHSIGGYRYKTLKTPCPLSWVETQLQVQTRPSDLGLLSAWGYMLAAGSCVESEGGQFPSHPGRLGPETSSEGAHLTPNPQEIQTGFASLPPSLPPHPPSSLSIHFPPSPSSSHQQLCASPSRQKSPINSKHLYGQGPIWGPLFPEPTQMKFYSLHENLTGGLGGRKNRK